MCRQMNNALRVHEEQEVDADADSTSSSEEPVAGPSSSTSLTRSSLPYPLDGDVVMDEGSISMYDPGQAPDLLMDEDFFNDEGEARGRVFVSLDVDEDMEDALPRVGSNGDRDVEDDRDDRDDRDYGDDGDDSDSEDSDSDDSDSDDSDSDDSDSDDSDSDHSNGDHGNGDHGDKDYEDHDFQPLDEARWSEDTVQTEAMVRLGVSVNTAAKVLICTSCRTAIKPSDLPQHLSRVHHPMSTTSEASDELATAYGLREDLEWRPGTIITAIYGLDVLGGYLACETCGYACKTHETMTCHIKKSKRCKSFRDCPVQTLRPSSRRLYFGVRPAPLAVGDLEDALLDPLTHMKKFTPKPFSQIPIQPPNSPRDSNNFLSLERWDLYVQGKTGTDLNDATRGREAEYREDVRICVNRFTAQITNDLARVGNQVKSAMADYIG